MIGFIIGIFVGAFLGIIIMAICKVSAQANIAKEEQEIILKQRAAEVQEQKLSATIKRQTVADKYQAMQKTDADKYKDEKDAEADIIKTQKED